MLIAVKPTSFKNVPAKQQSQKYKAVPETQSVIFQFKIRYNKQRIRKAGSMFFEMTNCESMGKQEKKSLRECRQDATKRLCRLKARQQCRR